MSVRTAPVLDVVASCPQLGDAAALNGVASLCALLRLLPERDPHEDLFEMADAIVAGDDPEGVDVGEVPAEGDMSDEDLAAEDRPLDISAETLDVDRDTGDGGGDTPERYEPAFEGEATISGGGEAPAERLNTRLGHSA